MCSLTIAQPITQPLPQRKEKVTVTEPGMYRIAATGVVYLVERSRKHTDRLYAKKLLPTYIGKKLHKLQFEYMPGAIYRLEPSDRMTPAEVAELGKLTGHCWVCSKKLTVKKSIDAGIGPVCAKKV